jgi:hypothetical protein
MLCAVFFRTSTVCVENPDIAAIGLIDDFWGSNGEASPYPSACVVRSSASSSARLTGKPFSESGLSWLSFSPSKDLPSIAG